MNSYITSSDYECKGLPLKTFVVSLTNGDKKTCKAETVETDECGSLSGLIHDGERVDEENFMASEVVWLFAPGTWLYVERVQDEAPSASILATALASAMAIE